MIDRLVIFGGTGEVTGRYLLPGLAAVLAQGHLSERFEAFRSWAAGWLGREEATVDDRAATTLVKATRYRRLDFADPASVSARVAGAGPVAVYLARPPRSLPDRDVGPP